MHTRVLSIPKTLQGANGLLRPTLQRRVQYAGMTAEPMNRSLHGSFSIASDSSSKAAGTRNVLVTLRDSDGNEGFGEGAPFFGISRDSQADLLSDICAANSTLASAAITDRDAAAFECSVRGCLDWPAARAAVDMAWWNMLAVREGLPLAQVINPEAQVRPLQTDVSIPIVSAEIATHLTETYLSQGFRRFKIKVGDDLDAARARMTAVHAAASQGEFLLDANEGYHAADAISLLAHAFLIGMPITIFEQPVKRHDFAGLAAVREAAHDFGALVFADESVYTLADAQRVLDGGLVDGINLKLMKHGTIIEALRIAELARERGAKLMIGGMIETDLAANASYHLACALGGLFWHDLDAPMLLKPETDQPMTRLRYTGDTISDPRWQGA